MMIIIDYYVSDYDIHELSTNLKDASLDHLSENLFPLLTNMYWLVNFVIY